MIVLEERETAQETFDLVVERLRKQGKHSVNGAGLCVYGEPGGVRCAIGLLMGRHPDPGTGSLSTLVDRRRVSEPKHLDLLRCLQNDHDASRKQFNVSCPTRMIETAVSFGLNPQSAVEWRDGFKA